MNLTLCIWRQCGADQPGGYERFSLTNVSPDLSVLEALDQLNEQLIRSGERPVSFDHDCREGICGSCGFLVNGQAHGPRAATSVCQLYLRQFADGAVLTLEPWRARAFPLIQDLMVDRSAFDRLIAAGGYCSTGTGQAPDGNALPVGRDQASSAFAAATCIGCGACVAACKNASAMLFVAAKAAHLNLVPQGEPESDRRVLGMVRSMDEAGFGNCTNQYECSAACPKEISENYITKLNRNYALAVVKESLGS